MVPLAVFLFGLEVNRFPASDDAADALGSSLDAIQSGSWTLSPYDGPAIQPYVGARLRKLELGLAPGAAWTMQTATASDGRESNLRTFQWRLEGRVRYVGGPWFAGLDGGYSDGSAKLQDTTVAEGSPMVELSPTGGLKAPLASQVDLVLRVRWPVRVTEGTTTHGPGGAIGLEWHP